jgi:S-adenosylmethionine-diacylglycerol 3-amino-3-carboxypropyl transferase
MSIAESIGQEVFKLVHRNNLVYNTCWEDPRLDREALQLGPDDTVLMISSAGCNALDYALTGPKRIYCVDLNPRQNALLELKLAGIKNLDHPTFFAMFGEGHLPEVAQVYAEKLRDSLSPWSQKYWDRRIGFFDGRRSFYFRGSSGALARLINVYIDHVARVRPWVEEILAANSVEQQRQIYDEHLYHRFWTRVMWFAMNRDTTMSLVGVPPAQRQQVRMHHGGSMARFIQDSVEAVLTRLPLSDNYFWRVYMTGRYTADCCPEYLRAESFAKLKEGMADCIEVHTASVQGFLDNNDAAISRFVLLDHMDWLSDRHYSLLEAEWQAIFRRAAPKARAIWRSGGLQSDFVDRAKITLGGCTREVGSLLQYHSEWAKVLHAQCRVHTYGSFYIADLAV